MTAAPSVDARPGTLEEDQVRAMFDRIAGVYDVMNTVMTAGLHHRWRERAADLAAGRHAAGEFHRQVAGAGRHVQCARPLRHRRQVGRPLAPAVVQTRRHDRVHDVVEARDAIEHRAHLPLL